MTNFDLSDPHGRLNSHKLFSGILMGTMAHMDPGMYLPTYNK